MDIIAAVLAVCPSLMLLLYTRKKGRSTDKPLHVLMYMFTGGIIVCPFVYAFETVLDYALIGLFNKSYAAYTFLACFIEAGFIEELFKLLMFGFLSSRFEKYYKTVFDGILFSVCVSLGFAVFENILYTFIYSVNGLETAFLRALTPGHFCFSVFMGLLFSESKKHENYDQSKYRLFALLSLLIPTVIHGFYDFCLSVGGVFSLVMFVLLMIALYLFVFITIKKKSENVFFL